MTLRQLRRRLWLAWRRFTGQCVHNAHCLVHLDARTSADLCNDCGAIISTWRTPEWVHEYRATRAAFGLPPAKFYRPTPTHPAPPR